MEMYIKKKVGKEVYNFVVQGENLFELVQESQKLSFPDVDKCGICGSNNLHLNSRLAQNKFKYVEVKCGSCMGSLTFGSKMENPDIYYLRKNKQKSWIGK